MTSWVASSMTSWSLRHPHHPHHHRHHRRSRHRHRLSMTSYPSSKISSALHPHHPHHHRHHRRSRHRHRLCVFNAFLFSPLSKSLIASSVGVGASVIPNA